jgi:hypothetical protein
VEEEPCRRRVEEEQDRIDGGGGGTPTRGRQHGDVLEGGGGFASTVGSCWMHPHAKCVGPMCLSSPFLHIRGGSPLKMV